MHANPVKGWLSAIKGNEIFAVMCTMVLIAALHFSRSLVTVASVGLWAAAIYKVAAGGRWKWSVIQVVLLFLALLWLLDGARAIDRVDWMKSIMVKGGFVLTALAFYSYRRMHWRGKLAIFYALVLSFLFTSTVSVAGYFQSAEEINILLLQSKHVPLFSKMHHIHYGLFLAVAVFVSAYVASGKEYSHFTRWFFGSAGLVILFNLHVLSSRTGLTGFYAAGMAVVLMVLIFSKDNKLKLAMIAGFVLLPAIFIFSLPSLRNKVLNTKEDLSATVSGGEEINHKSFGMRVEAWKSTAYVIKDHWLTGVGTGNQKPYLKQAYIDRKTMLSEENRISTHNQLLETFMTNGLPGAACVLLILFVCGIASLRKRSWLYIALFILTVWGLQFESMLERQHSAFFVAFILFFFYPEE